MTGSDDSYSNTRPISVAELLAKNGTIGAPPVGGRRRRRRGNADSVTVAELTGRDGTVTGVRLGDGTVVPADVVVVGVGIAPNDLLARESGLAVGNGITVDQWLRTSDPDVFAAGDVADAYHPTLARHVRVERVATDATNEVARYAALLATGTYAAAYLGVALSR